MRLWPKFRKTRRHSYQLFSHQNRQKNYMLSMAFLRFSLTWQVERWMGSTFMLDTAEQLIAISASEEWLTSQPFWPTPKRMDSKIMLVMRETLTSSSPTTRTVDTLSAIHVANTETATKICDAMLVKHSWNVLQIQICWSVRFQEPMTPATNNPQLSFVAPKVSLVLQCFSGYLTMEYVCSL